MKKMPQRICAWFLTILLLIAACLLPYFSKDTLAVSESDVTDRLAKAAQVQAVTLVMKECVSGEIKKMNGTALNYHSVGVSAGPDQYLFNGMGSTDVATGAWLEAMVQNKVNNGTIYCNDNNSNIVNVFMQTLRQNTSDDGISWEEIVCNGNDPGLFFPVTDSDYRAHNPKTLSAAKKLAATGSCTEALKKPKEFVFYWEEQDKALDYLKKLYDDYKTGTKDNVGQYLPEFENIGMFNDKAVGYYLYWNDFTTTCNDGKAGHYTTDSTNIDKAKYWQIPTIPDSAGRWEMRYYSQNDTGISGSHTTNWHNSIVKGGATTCNEVVERLNNKQYYTAVQSRIEAAIGSAVSSAQEEADKRFKENCRLKALYGSNVKIDDDGNATILEHKFANDSAAYAYSQAKKIYESYMQPPYTNLECDPEKAQCDYSKNQLRQQIVNELRQTLEKENPDLSSEQIDELLASKDKEINTAWGNIAQKAKKIYDDFQRVLDHSGTSVGTDGTSRPKKSFWYQGESGIFCTEFESFDGTIVNNSNYQSILKSLIAQATTTEGGIPGLSPDDTAGSVSADEDPCYKAGGSLGWIVCPVVKAVSDTLTGVYDHIIQPFLEIRSSWLEVNGEQSVYGGWSSFRDFANIIFAILFLIVIFSQVTGFGLDNYGIKKILPKLIMVAVLVNISFILCQLAVDVSNLLGSALQGLFEGLAGKITMPAVDGFASGKWFSLSGIVSTILTTLFAGGAVAAIVVTWEVWLIPFLLALLGCVIGVLFFFIVLGIRQAGVLILVALAPVAIVCYALPNTKVFFDKWKKMFMGLLVVYPICGLLIGGGQFASALLIAAGTSGGAGTEGMVNFFYMLVAMLVSVIPFFFIPSILRSSMVAMGNLGMKVAGFGSRFSNGLRRTIGGADGVKEAQRGLSMRNAERAFNRLDRKAERRGRLNAIDKRRRSGAAMRYNRLAMEDFKAGGNQELLKPGSVAWKGLETKQLAMDTEGQKNIYESQLNTGNAGEVGEEYEKQLEALHANPNDRSTLVRVRALQDILSESDPGRSQIRSRMLSVAQRHADEYKDLTPEQGKNTALGMAADHLMTGYNGLMKKSNRGTWSMLGHFQGGDFKTLFNNGGITAFDKDGQALPSGAEGATAYNSSFYSKLGLNGYNAMSLVEADDDVRDGINRGIKDGSISGESKADIVSLAAEAYGNQNVHFQPKVAKQIRETLISGNDEKTIGGVDAQALKRLAGDISSKTLAGASRDKLVGMAKTALKTEGLVTNAERAEQLNNILTAAGEEAIPFNGKMDTKGKDKDSGSLPVRDRILGQNGGRTPGGVIIPNGRELDEAGEILRREKENESVRKNNERRFRER